MPLASWSLWKAGGVRKERIRDKALKAVGLFIEFAQQDHVLKALFKRFNRSKQHRTVRWQPNFVSLTVNLEVFSRTFLAVADNGPNIVIEDFCTTTRKRGQAGVFEAKKHFFGRNG